MENTSHGSKKSERGGKWQKFFGTVGFSAIQWVGALKEVHMTRRISLLAGMALLIVSMVVSGASRPVIVGTISGFELCPQSICDKAYFAGRFAGTVNGKPTAGVFSAGVTHGDLPDNVGGTAPITGGTWMVRTKTKVFAGTVTTGTLTYNGDDTYTVVLTLALNEGGSGTLQFTGLLDHGPFPPTIIGTLSQ